MNNTVTTATSNADLKATIKAYLNQYRVDHLQELYPSGGMPQQEWVYDALAEFMREEVKAMQLRLA
jgi:hypothetical protein